MFGSIRPFLRPLSWSDLSLRIKSKASYGTNASAHHTLPAIIFQAITLLLNKSRAFRAYVPIFELSAALSCPLSASTCRFKRGAARVTDSSPSSSNL
jgi:hypothetical protein